MTVNLEVHDQVLLIEIDRPEARNALDVDAMVGLSKAWAELASNDELRAGVITGVGDRSFSAGADLRSVVANPPENLLELVADALLARRTERRKPIIAAVNGACIGGGCMLLLGTDLRIASEAAIFSLTGVKLGAYAPFVIPKLTAQVNYGTAARMLLQAERIDAAEALASGLVSEVCPPERVRARALEIGAQIAAYDTDTVASITTVLETARAGEFAAAAELDERIAGSIHAR
jgi:enoyl-CoA hydratase/carnithine racemase